MAAAFDQQIHVYFSWWGIRFKSTCELSVLASAVCLVLAIIPEFIVSENCASLLTIMCKHIPLCLWILVKIPYDMQRHKSRNIAAFARSSMSVFLEINGIFLISATADFIRRYASYVTRHLNWSLLIAPKPPPPPPPHSPAHHPPPLPVI